MSEAEIEELQLLQFRLLLDHCRSHVPFYRQLPAASQIQCLADFRRLIPPLSREACNEHSASLVARELPEGTQFTATIFTSGTSGIPVPVRLTNMVNLWWLAFYLRDLEWCQIDPRLTQACIRAACFADPVVQEQFHHGLSLPYWNASLHHVVETGNSWGLDVRRELNYQMNWLCQVKPDYLLSYPSNLQGLARLIIEENRQMPDVMAVQTISEELAEEDRCLIERAFAAPVKNTYSCVEAGYLASPCPEASGFHVHSENIILEILNERDQPCEPGETGRIVITTLHNFLTPFIRYEILDQATLADKQCVCGRGLPLLKSIGGKQRPLFVLNHGARKSSSALVATLSKISGIRQLQLVQQEIDLIEVKIVPGNQWVLEQTDIVGKEVCAYFSNKMRCIVQLQDRLELTTSGKLRTVVINVS